MNTLIGVSILLLANFVILATFIQSDFIAWLDTYMIEAVQQIKNPYLTDVMKFFTYIGDTDRVIIISFLIAMTVYFFFRKWREIFLFVVVLLGSATFMRLLKEFFQRERPTLYKMISVGGYSFPSGHSMMAFALYGVTCFLLWKHIPNKTGRISLLTFVSVIIFAIGFSRVYLGVHYPSDIIGGFLFSGFWLLFSIWGFRMFEKLRVTRKEKSKEL